jgi:hypothetical protein
MDMSTLINLLPLPSVALKAKLPQTILFNQHISILQILQHQLEPISLPKDRSSTSFRNFRTINSYKVKKHNCLPSFDELINWFGRRNM